MLYLLSIITFSLCQDIPFIESIEPAFGGFGSTIILNGGNFSKITPIYYNCTSKLTKCRFNRLNKWNFLT